MKGWFGSWVFFSEVIVRNEIEESGRYIFEFFENWLELSCDV